MTSVPRQASEAERIVFELLRGLRAPGLGVLFFHGRHYAGRTAKHTSGSNLITREHDYVLLVRYNGERAAGVLWSLVTGNDSVALLE